MSEEKKNNNWSTYLNIPLLIANFVIIANTKRDTFDQLGLLDYYHYLIFVLVLTGVITLLPFLVCCGICCVGLVSSDEPSSQCEQMITRLTIFVCLIIIGLNYWLMGLVWHAHPEYSVIFYNRFWSESVIPSPPNVVLEKHWAYLMADIVIRCYSLLVVVFTIIGVPILVYFGGLVKIINCINSSNQADDYLIPRNFGSTL